MLVCDLGGMEFSVLAVVEEQGEEACYSNPHRVQSVALARVVDAHDATVGGMVAA